MPLSCPRVTLSAVTFVWCKFLMSSCVKASRKAAFAARITPLISSRQNRPSRKGCRERAEHGGWSPPQTLPATRADLRIQRCPCIHQLPPERDGGSRGSQRRRWQWQQEKRQPWHSLELCRSQGKALPGWMKRQITHTGVRKATSPTRGYNVLQPAADRGAPALTGVSQPFTAAPRAKEIIMEKANCSVPHQ